MDWRRQWHPTPVLLPGKSHGWRSLVGCSPWGREESDTTEWLHFPFSLSYIGEGNGNPLQCSCLENPRDGGAWWVAIYGVAQGRKRLTRLSSSSNMKMFYSLIIFKDSYWSFIFFCLWEKFVHVSSPIFFSPNGIIVFFSVVCKNSLYMLCINLLSCFGSFAWIFGIQKKKIFI